MQFVCALLKLKKIFFFNVISFTRFVRQFVAKTLQTGPWYFRMFFNNRRIVPFNMFGNFTG
ncbi:MAG: hypothetical protein DI582_04640 [Azospirillum brasilense]|nr:MAG: hypothetical protein DI582_04640 [Azospirillum brasilense]